MKTLYLTSTRTFDPRGKYVPPPIRDGQMYGEVQAPTSTLAAAATATAITTSSQLKGTLQVSRLGTSMANTASGNAYA